MSAVCWAVVPAAGVGARMGLGYNKVFMPLNGVPMIVRTLTALKDSGMFAGIVVSTGADDIARMREILSANGFGDTVLTTGGETRQQSVLNGLYVLPYDAEFVAVHDAARPYVTNGIISAVLQSAYTYGSGVICTPVTDTIKRTLEGRSVETLPRDELRAVQTPQAFRVRELIAALEGCRDADIAVTDEAQAMELTGREVKLVMCEGAEKNMKVTYQSDISDTKPEFRVGYGYDAHRLVEDRRLVLCGVEIPHEKGLLGHSDADVATHALIDALLGAAGLGDIGRLYPDTDAKYKDVYSIELLRDTVKRLAAAGYAVVNCDMTIVAQRPKLSPHTGDMTRCLADAIGVAPDSVNIKGKTTEGMGFEGAGEGISAHCAVLIRRIYGL